MTMAATTLASNAAAAGAAVKNRYYDKLFLRIAESKLVHKQLGQVNRQIPSGEGGFGTGTVAWTRFVNLAAITSASTEGATTTAVSLSASNVTGSTAQYDNAVSISDILAYTSFGDVMKAAIERLAYNAGISIDTIVRNTIALSGTVYGGRTYAFQTSANATAYSASIADIRRARRILKRNDAMELEDGCFVSVLHPDILIDLQSDASTGGWIDANKYTEANADKLLKGEAGKLLGTRFLETSNGYVWNSSAAGSPALYMSLYMGRDAFGVTELQSLKTYVKGFESGGTGDPTEKVATAGWKTTFGATVLNSSFYVQMVNWTNSAS